MSEDITTVEPAGKAFSPLDDSLRIPKGYWSEGVAKGICRLGARMPFEAAAEDFEELTAVRVSAKDGQRLVHRYGTALFKVLQAEGETSWELQGQSEPVAPDQRPKRRAASVDGTYIHLRGANEWKEVKVGSVFDYERWPSSRAPGEYEVKAKEISYCVYVGEAKKFEPLMWAEMERRQLPWAEEQVAVSDAGIWVRNLLGAAMPEGVHILDWYHACERLWEVAHAACGRNTPQAKAQAQSMQTDLWKGKVTTVLDELQDLLSEHPGNETIADAVTYFNNQSEMMHYPEYRQHGYPIGSGNVESACKNVVGARCKGSGMRWSESGAQAVLSLRSELLSHRWATAWSAARDSSWHSPPI